MFLLSALKFVVISCLVLIVLLLVMGRKDSWLERWADWWNRLLHRHRHLFKAIWYVFLTACILSLLILLIWLLWKWPELQLKLDQLPEEELNQKEKLQLINEYRRTVAQIIIGFTVVFGLFFTWKRIRATEEQVHIAREEQITERFTRAVDQLGSENIHVQLGGIYALERISKDSSVDYGTVMEVLAAFVRERAPWPVDADQVSQEKLKPDTQVQAVLTILRRRGTRRYGQEEHLVLDLSSTNLNSANLSQTNLFRANIRKTNLGGADLSGANLMAADLSGADLSEANLRGTNLLEANLFMADLSEANLSQANLFRANISQEQIDSAFYCEKYPPSGLTGRISGIKDLHKLKKPLKPPPWKKCDENGNPIEK